jgi:hypothetical protein
VKVAVLIPSRGRTGGVYRVVTTLRALESGKNDIVYVVGCDHDDPDTARMARIVGATPYIMARKNSLGEMVNAMAEAHPADAYCSLADDVEMKSRWWDEYIRDACDQVPGGVFWWQSQNGAAYAIVSEAWRKAAGYIFTGYFLFWFDDCWLIQLWMYASGQHLIKLEAHIHDHATKTHRMADYDKWHDFYWSRDGERVEEGARIAKALGWPVLEDPQSMRLEEGSRITPEQEKAWTAGNA